MRGRIHLLPPGDQDPALGTPTQGEDLSPPKSPGLSGRQATLPIVAKEGDQLQDPVLQIMQTTEWGGAQGLGQLTPTPA